MELSTERPPTPLGGRTGCLAIVLVAPGSLSAGGDVPVGLAKIPLGGRVKVRLRPLTPGADGHAKLGKTYVSYPRLRSADLRLKGSTARRELRRLGCKNRPLPLA